MDDILAEDMENIFLFDFGQNVLIQSGGAERGARGVIEPGVQRLVDDRYIQAAYEITVAAAERLQADDLVLALDDDGVVVGRYRVGMLLERDTVSRIYQLQRDQLP